MSDLTDLYQEVILDHNKKPRNFVVLDDADGCAEGHNPLCGDKVKVFVKMVDDHLERITFQGNGCAISQASASLMTEALQGKSRAEAEHLFDLFHRLLTGDPSDRSEAEEELGKLGVFGGVRQYPMRVKCATLAWHTLKSALEGEVEAVTTEN